MTSLQVVYDAFLSKMLDDEWGQWTQEEVEQDLFELLKGAIPWFKFPRVDLTLNEDNTGFVGDLTNDEVQILATYMKCEWLNRTIMTWENVKTLYEERDFSQANLLDSFRDMLAREEEKAANLERVYYRSRSDKPFEYRRLAGDRYVPDD